MPKLYDEWVVSERELLRLRFQQSLRRLVTWLLQLVVSTDSTRYSVELLEETVIIHNDRKVPPGLLISGLNVRIDGDVTGTDAMMAERIFVQ